MKEIENDHIDLKLYSLKGIGLATFFGSPLAASILIRSNYIALGKEESGRNALIIGVVSTILLFSSMYIIPESIITKIPNSIIPGVYTFIIYLIVNKLQGSELEDYEADKNKFYSNWRAVGIGLLCTIIILGGLLAYSYKDISNPAYKEYEAELEKFYENEMEAHKFYDHMDSHSVSALLQELRNTVIPNWRENIRILESTNNIENLPDEMKKRNEKLMEFSELRVETYLLLRKVITEDTDSYNGKLDSLHEKAELLMEEINDL